MITNQIKANKFSIGLCPTQ